jgi:HEAT repeat protein
MNVNRRTLMLLIIFVAVIGGVYAITLWQRGRETARLLTEVQSTNHGTATEAIVSLRERVPSVRPELINLMRHADPDVRWRAALLLGETTDRESRDALLAALTDEAPTVRTQATLALGKREVRTSADRIALIAATEWEDLAVRVAALQALRMLRAGEYLDQAMAIAGDRPPPPPPPAESEDAEEEEVEEYTDDTALLRAEAVHAVATLAAAHPDAARRADGIEMLVASTNAAEEPNADVRRAACYAIGDLAAGVRSDELQRSAVNALIAAMDDELGDVRIAATHTLRIMSTPAEMRDSVRRAMNSALNDDHYWVRQVAEEAVSGG